MEDNSDSMVGSTLKTIRSLKVKNSYNKLSSGSEGQPSSQNSTRGPPETPPEAQDIDFQSNQYLHMQNFRKTKRNEDSKNQTPKVHLKKAISLNNSSSVRISSKKILKSKIENTKSETQISETEDTHPNAIDQNDHQGDPITQNQFKFHRGRKVLAPEEVKVNNSNDTRVTEIPDQLKSSISSSQLIANLQNRATKEYKVIDIDYAIQYVLRRSKQIEQKIEEEGLFPSFIENSIINSKFFKISYDSYLQTEINKKNINEGFKNVNKRMFEKLEDFFLNRIQKCLDQSKLQQSYVRSSKGIYNKLDEKLKELKNDLKNIEKIE